MQKRIRLGFFTHVEGPGDPGQIYQETFELFCAAESLGFDSVWVAEHHFKDTFGRLPSPFPFLAAAAQRTQRVRLGTSIVVIPFENPMRVAEDAAVLDTLSGGRLELGLGSGGDPAEFEAYGVALDERQTRTTTGLHTLQRALRGEKLNQAGQTLQPAAPDLVNRLWQSAVSPIGAQYVARHGAGLLLSRAAWHAQDSTDVVQIPLADAYLNTWQDVMGDSPQTPRIGLSRGVYPAADKATALSGLREGVMHGAQRMIQQGMLPGNLTLEEYCQRLHVAFGHPEEVAATLSADRMLPYATDLILQFSPAMPKLADCFQMLEQIATQVAPALGWQSEA